jgi:hypothetical protein
MTGGVSQGDYDWDCGGYNHSNSRDCGKLRLSRRCCTFLYFIVIVAGVIALAIIPLLTQHRTSLVKYVLIYIILLL